MAGTLDLAETAIYNALTANANLMATVTGVYDTQLPPGVSPSAAWCIFQHVSGGDENTNPATSLMAKWRIECISPTLATAQAAAGYIRAAMLINGGVSIPTWDVWMVQEEDAISMMEDVLGVPYYRKGAFYKIAADSGRLESFNTTYQAAVLAIPNLVAYWPLNEVSGTVAVDLVAGANGTYNGCTLNSLAGPGPSMGNAPQFNGSSNYVQLPSSTLNSGFNPAKGTLAIWANLSATWNDFSQRTAMVVGTDFNNSVQIFKDGGGTFLVDGFYEANGTSVFAKASYALSGWHHYAVTWNTASGALIFYIDGVAQGSPQAIASGYVGALQDAFCRLGQRSGGNLWQGWLDGALLAGRDLAQSEIRTLALAV